MVMGVKGREARLLDQGGFVYEFGLRGKVLEFHVFFTQWAQGNQVD
jgi:hypothetical protein